MRSLWKKIVLGILAASMTAALALGAAACNDNDNEHTHVDADGDGKCDECNESIGGTGSGPQEGSDDKDPDNKDPNDKDPDDGSGKVSYSIRLQRSSGDPFARCSAIVYDASDNMMGYFTTNSEGVGKVDLVPGDYYLTLIDLPDGYTATDSLLTADETEYTFTYSASLITGQALKRTYAVGDVMTDFSFTDSTGFSSSLSELLEEKDVVVLNFWGTHCSWCVEEFPDMLAAYEPYADRVAIVALSSYSGGDTTAEVEAFRRGEGAVYPWSGTDGLPFHMVSNEDPVTIPVTSAFGVTGFPTTAVIDREGVITAVMSGAGSERDFTFIFDKYTGDDYEQDIMFPGEDLEAEVPDVEGPSSREIADAVNASGFSAEYFFVPEGEESQHELIWPWLVGEKDGESCLYPANTGHDNSSAILYADVEAASGQAITFDYKASSEDYYDYLAVFVNGRLITEISGIGSSWRTCYAYIPIKQATYRLALAYVKDHTGTDGEDKVYVRNFRFVDAADVQGNAETVYPCADGEIDDEGVYSDYISAVYNPEDGYYHVESANGPLVLANLMEGTSFASRSAYECVMNGGFLFDLDGDGEEEDLTNRFIQFCQYANNSQRYGFLAVTEEIKSYLEAFTAFYGLGSSPDEWLELCSFVKQYGAHSGEELGDPAIGLTDYNAYIAVENKGTEAEPDAVNHVVVDRVLMPRGFWFKFVPESSGVYHIMSLGDYDTYAWLRNDKLDIIMESDDIDFRPDDIAGSNGNFGMTAFLEKGKAYYVACAFFGIEQLGAYDFIITRLAAEGDYWMPASEEYTYEVDYDDAGNEIYGDVYLKAIETELGDDGFYYALNEDGTRGSKVYIDLLGTTSMFAEYSVNDLKDMTYWFCTKCHAAQLGGTNAPDACNVCGGHTFAQHKAFELPTPVVGKDGKIQTTVYSLGSGEEAYTMEVPVYETDARGNVIFTDYTDVIKEYIAKAANEANYPKDEDGTPHYGFIAADETLVDVLQKFIVFGDFSMHPNIDNAWLMLSHYYLHLGGKEN